MGRGGALVESTPFVRRVMGSTPALAATHMYTIRTLGKSSLTVACGSAELDLKSRLQIGVGGVSHFQQVSGSLDIKNHRGACPPSWH